MTLLSFFPTPMGGPAAIVCQLYERFKGSGRFQVC